MLINAQPRRVSFGFGSFVPTHYTQQIRSGISEMKGNEVSARSTLGSTTMSQTVHGSCNYYTGTGDDENFVSDQMAICNAVSDMSSIRRLSTIVKAMKGSRSSQLIYTNESQLLPEQPRLISKVLSKRPFPLAFELLQSNTTRVTHI